MKVLFRISLFLIVGCLTFTIGVFFGHSYEKRPSYDTYAKKEEVLRVSTADNKVDCDTVYMVEAFDTNTQTTIEETEELPAKYIGMTREQMEKELEDYSLAPSLRDQEKGFLTASLSSFSKEKVVVRKNYCIYEPECYYLAADNNYVIVYEKDRETVYTTTDILLEDLPKDLQNEIINMKCLTSEEEVYHFLESHSS